MYGRPRHSTMVTNSAGRALEVFGNQRPIVVMVASD